MNAIRSNNVSFKYLRFTSGCKNIGFTKTEFVAKTQFLCLKKDNRFEMYNMVFWKMQDILSQVFRAYIT